MSLEIPETVRLPWERLGVHSTQFFHSSTLHGADHVNRVIVHCFRLCRAMAYEGIAPECWAAAYLHDLARRHDGVCTEHGRWAVEILLPSYKCFFLEAGVRRLDVVCEAVVLHATDLENPDNQVCNVLKDADALDRCRWGDLDVGRLRLAPSAGMIPFAERLFRQTQGASDWMPVWHASLALLQLAQPPSAELSFIQSI